MVSRRKLIASALILSVLNISGCATVYKEPSDTSVATLTFINDSAIPMDALLYGDATECSDMRRIGGGVKANSERMLKVRSGENLAVTAIVGIDVPGTSAAFAFGAIGLLASADSIVNSLDEAGCRVTLDFSPQIGRSYVLRMSSDGKSCTHQFYESPSEGNAFIKTTYTKREPIRGISNGIACKKK